MEILATILIAAAVMVGIIIVATGIIVWAERHRGIPELFGALPSESAVKTFLGRKPSRVIGDNYLLRWHLIPRNRYFNIYLHCFLGSDDDRALHDHPWWSLSFLLKGVLWEALSMDVKHPPKNMVESVVNTGLIQDGKFKRMRWLLPMFRSKGYKHRLILDSKTAWTLFFTGPSDRHIYKGKEVSKWGFHCPKGWVHWMDFTDPSGNQIGKGCD